MQIVHGAFKYCQCDVECVTEVGILTLCRLDGTSDG